MAAKEKSVKRLYDFSIFPWGLTGFAENDYYMYGTKTVLIKNLGIDYFESKTDNYRVHASASKHLIGLHRADGDHFGIHPDKLKLEDEIFFKGVIAVYNKDGLLQDGPIWIAFKPSDKFTQEDGLAKVILGNAKTDKENDKVIEAIVNAYVQRERNNAKDESDAKHRAFQDGMQSGRWRDRHGYSF